MASAHLVADDDLVYETRGAIGLIRINRPAQLGAFTWPMLDRWAQAAKAAVQGGDPSRVVRVAYGSADSRNSSVPTTLRSRATASKPWPS